MDWGSQYSLSGKRKWIRAFSVLLSAPYSPTPTPALGCFEYFCSLWWLTIVPQDNPDLWKSGMQTFISLDLVTYLSTRIMSGWCRAHFLAGSYLSTQPTIHVFVKAWTTSRNGLRPSWCCTVTTRREIVSSFLPVEKLRLGGISMTPPEGQETRGAQAKALWLPTLQAVSYYLIRFF